MRLRTKIFSWVIILLGCLNAISSFSPFNIIPMVGGLIGIFCGIGLLQRINNVRKFVVFICAWQSILNVFLFFFLSCAAILNHLGVQSGGVFDYAMEHPSTPPWVVFINASLWVFPFFFFKSKGVKNEFVDSKTGAQKVPI